MAHVARSELKHQAGLQTPAVLVAFQFFALRHSHRVCVWSVASEHWCNEGGVLVFWVWGLGPGPASGARRFTLL